MLLDFVSLIYPRYCLACSGGLIKGEDILCTGCIRELPRAEYHFRRENPLYKRISGRISIENAFAFLLFSKGGRAQQLIHELKYNNHPEIGRILGRVYGEELSECGYSSQFDVIIPVPLHPAKHKRRGYNQSEEFAIGLSERLNAPCLTNVLQRDVPTDTQTKKSKLKRWENVNSVFSISNRQLIAGVRILVVDDVITTGATVEACCNALEDAGCDRLSVCGLAYAKE
ncbi:MAG: ComF family protein [Cyclobacteriaceae bacterium]|nr:ComF family protein [Cyclobacteriaceae bacterium]